MSDARFRWLVVILLAMVLLSVGGWIAATTANKIGGVCKLLYSSNAMDKSETPEDEPEMRFGKSERFRWDMKITAVDGTWPDCQCDKRTYVQQYSDGRWHSPETVVLIRDRFARSGTCPSWARRL